MDLAQELRRLADDFDRLADPARDEMLFIYDWQPPDWLNYPEGRAFPPEGFDGRKINSLPMVSDRLIEIAATLREAAKKLEG